MTDYRTYYNTTFRQDINQFFSTIPDESRFHQDKEKKQILSIQYERLTTSKNHLDFLNSDDREYFAVALFFTILSDMVCYTYYQGYYNKFQSLTKYPKLIGNCLSWCRYHLHPKEIFVAMNQGKTATEKHLVFRDKFLEAIEPMKDEMTDFFENYLTEINGEDFWNKCKNEFPYK